MGDRKRQGEALEGACPRCAHRVCMAWPLGSDAKHITKADWSCGLLELSSKHLWTFASHHRKKHQTAAHVVSSAVNLSSVLHCLHMATRSLSPGSLSYTAGTDIYMTAVSTGSSPESLFVSLMLHSQSPTLPPLSQTHESNSSPLFKWAPC